MANGSALGHPPSRRRAAKRPGESIRPGPPACAARSDRPRRTFEPAVEGSDLDRPFTRAATFATVTRSWWTQPIRVDDLDDSGRRRTVLPHLGASRVQANRT